jgi:hypothetical protein
VSARGQSTNQSRQSVSVRYPHNAPISHAKAQSCVRRNSAIVGAHPSGCYDGVLMGPGVGALRQPPRLQSGDTFGIFTMRNELCLTIDAIEIDWHDLRVDPPRADMVLVQLVR